MKLSSQTFIYLTIFGTLIAAAANWSSDQSSQGLSPALIVEGSLDSSASVKASVENGALWIWETVTSADECAREDQVIGMETVLPSFEFTSLEYVELGSESALVMLKFSDQLSRVISKYSIAPRSETGGAPKDRQASTIESDLNANGLQYRWWWLTCGGERHFQFRGDVSHSVHLSRKLSRTEIRLLREFFTP